MRISAVTLRTEDLIRSLSLGRHRATVQRQTLIIPGRVQETRAAREQRIKRRPKIPEIQAILVIQVIPEAPEATAAIIIRQARLLQAQEWVFWTGSKTCSAVIRTIRAVLHRTALRKRRRRRSLTATRRRLTFSVVRFLRITMRRTLIGIKNSLRILEARPLTRMRRQRSRTWLTDTL